MAEQPRPLPSLESLFPFPLDSFQKDAIRALEAGRNVVVCAPTGAGKTVVAEFATWLALSNGARCFYTTPLKALSNQKFFDFRHSLGSDRVGLLTGDISIQRDADVVVMTTEVFRNMLYGTVLGEVSRNLRGVKFVILDECHFMNDKDRGTVWEESVIYAPPEVQLVALSATIDNAEELRDWMTQVHGPTDLSITSHRPVPLRHYFFVDDKLTRLLNPDGTLNPALHHKTGPIKAGPPRRGRRMPGDHSRHEQPSLPRPSNDAVCKALDKRGMLPAIFFVFSRKGCEEALRECNKSVHITDAELDALQNAIDDALDKTPALRSHPHLPFLYQGVAAHHAGLLPSWKNLVERLFVQGLVKAVFATETLAAGINMPARTTVISAISKRADEGHRTLTASEFLQMSGRAGRRGMDPVGNVVVLAHPKERVEDAARLARAHADPLVSQFTPSYGMVLNLLQRHTESQCHNLLERSFGQFLAVRASGGLNQDLHALDEQIRRQSGPLCPDRIGDLRRYRRLYDELRALRRQSKSMGKGIERAARVPPELRDAQHKLQDHAHDLLSEAKNMPCHNCPVQEPCSKQEETLRRLHNRRDEMERRLKRVTTPYWNQFQQLAEVLEEFEYLKDRVPTAAGRLAAALRATNVLLLAEIIRSGVIDTLHPADAAAVLTAMVTEETRRQDYAGLAPSEWVERTLSEVIRIARTVAHVQSRHGITPDRLPVIINPVYSGLAQVWAEGASWDEMRDLVSFDEGDVVRALRRTVDLARQVAHAPEVPPATAQLARSVENLLARDEVKDEFLATQVPAEVLPEAEEGIEHLEELLEEDHL